MANNEHTHEARWTIMIYMAVDDANGISESFNFLKELEELKDNIPALQTNQVEYRDLRIFLQTYTNWNDQKGQPDFRSKRFEIDENFDIKKPLEVEFEENLSMGNEKALSDFIDWCKKTGEAENYLLFLWGHGTGSSMFSLQESYNNISELGNLFDSDLTITDLGTNRVITNSEAISPENLFKGRNTVRIRITLKGITSFVLTLSKRETNFYNDLRGDKKPVTLINLLTESNDLQTLSPEIDRLRKFLTTRSNLDGLLEQEISKCLKKVDCVDILLIMGCCMQMVEFGYELKDSRKDGKPFFYIASEELIYFDGYNYKDSFKALAEDPLMDAEALAKRIVLDAPVKNTYTEYQRQSLAISCVDLTKIDTLAGYLDSFATKVLDLEKKYDFKKDIWDKIKNARKQCRHFGEDAYTYSFIDVTWFFMRFYELLNVKYPNEFRDLVKEIRDFLKEEYIVQPWIGAGRIPSLKYRRSYGGHGVGIYFPESKQAHDNNVENGLGTAFDKNTPKGNGSAGKEKFPETNDFTKYNSWYDMILKYREEHGEKSNYPLTGSLAQIDKEKKKLLEDKDALINGLTTALLEYDKVKTDVIPNILLKIYNT